MIRQICNVKLQDIVTTRSNELLARLGIEDLDLILKEKAPLVRTCGTLQWCSQDSLWPTGWWKLWAREAKDDMEAADREGLQRVEALGYRPSWQTYLLIWCEICHTCSKPATWKRALWCGSCPCTCTLIKNSLMMMMTQVELFRNWTISSTYEQWMPRLAMH